MNNINFQNQNIPIILCIMDGWGINADVSNNAVKLAKTPNFDYFLNNFPNSKLEASGEHVGLPKNQIGNSEVGHMHLGSGRVILQSLPKINLAFKNKEIEDNYEFSRFLKEHSKENTVHVLGLYSEGGVHSHKDHIVNLSKILEQKKINFTLHLFSDGRDVSPLDFGQTIKNLHNQLSLDKKISSLIGRFYPMDRDNRWERIKKFYDLIIFGKGDFNYKNVDEAVSAAYKRGESDEFISPTIIDDYEGIKEGDSLIIVNFRSDRVRQVLDALVNPNFNKFKRLKDKPPFNNALGIWEYSETLNKYMKSVFKNDYVKDNLGEIVSRSGFSQLRLAETEKYPHVTFFFNGGNENKYFNEDRIMIPSPKVSTYDQKPEMSAEEIEQKLIFSIKEKKYDFIIVNFANPDMVGHTGNLKATIKAVETVDKAIGKLKKTIDETNGVILLTADHGNCELMWDKEKNSPHTAHTTSKVPLILISSKNNKNFCNVKLKDGSLANVAPTILELLGLNTSKHIKNNSLILNI